MTGNAPYPQWDVIMSGEPAADTQELPAIPPAHTPKPRSHKHQPAKPDIGARILQLFYGLAFLLAIISVFQLTWQVKGNELDAMHTQETIAINHGFDDSDIPVNHVAQPQAGDPPVEPQPADTQFIGWMHIPRLGDDWKRVIQEGTENTVLDNLGLGHYAQTVMPGAIGNTSYAGHRTPSDLGYADRLEAGDPIIIQTSTHWYVYRVEYSWIVPMSDVSVLNPDGDSRLLTLTTCDPMFHTPAPNRLIIRASFDYWANTADGLPAELSDEPVETGNPAKALTARITHKVRDISKRMPITPVLAAACAVIWLLLNGLFWLLFHKDREPKPMTWNVVALLWRIQAGPTALRVISFTLMWMAILFACWAWLCPLLAETIPWLETPYPGLE